MPKEKWTFVDKKREETKHRTEWCAEADRYRCLRCGRGSKYMKMPGKCTGLKFLSKFLENGESVIWDVMTWSEEWLLPEQMGTKEYDKMLKRIQVLEDGRVPAKETRSWRTEGQ